MRYRKTTCAVAACAALMFAGKIVLASDNPNEANPSQTVECNQVDKRLSFIPHGNGDGSVTADETAPGSWRYNGRGQSFVTFAHTYDGGSDEYVVVAGRSAVGANSTIINDYPETLDLPQAPQAGALGSVPN